MLRITVLAVLILSALTTPGPAAEVVAVPIDLGANELYPNGGSNYYLNFDAGRALSGITAVSLHVAGTYASARSICWNFGDFGGGTWSYNEDAGLSVGFWDAETTVYPTRHVFAPAEALQPYDRHLDFDTGTGEADWSFLSNGAGTFHLRGLPCEHNPSYPEVCTCEHSAVVNSLTLIIQLGTGVATEERSWGTIKGMYRP